MISTDHRFIFLHVPKTGGNALQTLLLPLSDDRMVTAGAQDGVNSFGIRGPITPYKHATLQDYADKLGDKLSSYRVIVTLRPPFERMISLYFSPHRWLSEKPVWNQTSFLKMVRSSAATADFLRVDGRIYTPDFVLRFGSLAHEFAKAAAALELPLAASDLPLRNPSAATSAAMQDILADAVLRRTVEDIFREDIMLTTTGQ